MSKLSEVDVRNFIAAYLLVPYDGLSLNHLGSNHPLGSHIESMV
jgi:hypothetical protein